MKKTLSVICALMMCFMLSACGSSSFNGKWEYAGYIEDGKEVDDSENVSFEFDDETVKFTEGKTTKDYYYVFEDDKLYFLNKKDDPLTDYKEMFQVKEHSSNKMILVKKGESGDGFIFKKK